MVSLFVTVTFNHEVKHATGRMLNFVVTSSGSHSQQRLKTPTIVRILRSALSNGRA
jgi:hypothetical protein